MSTSTLVFFYLKWLKGEFMFNLFAALASLAAILSGAAMALFYIAKPIAMSAPQESALHSGLLVVMFIPYVLMRVAEAYSQLKYNREAMEQIKNRS
jgi:hypothetical protein